MSERIHGATVDMKLPKERAVVGTKLPEGFYIGDISLDAVIGKGGSATVYKGTYPQKQFPDVAVKVGSDRNTFLKNEVQLNRTLQGQSPRLVAYIDHGTGNVNGSSRDFLVMEHLSGGSVHDRIQRQGPLPVETAVKYVGQTASGLHVMHDAELIHRDVKPENILLTKDGEAKLGDFGIATSYTKEGYRRNVDGEVVLLELDQTGKLIGTPLYMAPEQAEGDSSSEGPGTDTQGLGLSAFEMLRGVPVRDRTTSNQKQLEILRSPREYDEQIESAVTELGELGYGAFITPLRASLKRDVNKRPAPMELAVDLQSRLRQVQEDRNHASRRVFVPGVNINSPTKKIAA